MTAVISRLRHAFEILIGRHTMEHSNASLRATIMELERELVIMQAVNAELRRKLAAPLPAP
jgi:hypothetical protein